jgi:EpsI family protein
VYASPLGPPIETFIGYLSGQFANKRLNSPKLVFPSGWEYADMGQMKIPMPGGKQVDAIWLVVKKNQLKRIVLYWYQVGDKSFAGDLRHRFELIWNRFIHGRTDSAVARMATPIRESESAEQARERLASFSAYLYPEILRVLQ